MKAICLIALSIAISGFSIVAEELITISDSEAVQHIGQRVTVQGMVIKVTTSRAGNTFLNFGAPYPNQTFTGYIPAGTPLALDPWTSSLQGKVVGITGVVALYKGKPEIKILSKEQIRAASGGLGE
jgi:DNA/RNA endonuclease YhcR with UshA esterase domain